MRIMVVDDEPLNLAQFTEIAQEIDFIDSIASFDNYDEALDYVTHNIIDLAVLDIELGSQSGIDLAREIHNIDENISIIFITSYAQYALDAYSVDGIAYIMKPYLDEDVIKALSKANKLTAVSPTQRIQIKTFGGFDLFVDGKPVHFSRSKSKEILALLVDRQGASMTTAEMISYLWEDSFNDTKNKESFKKAFQTLKTTLAGCNASSILNDSYNCKSVNVDEFSCDYYDFLAGNQKVINTFNENYMPNYSWAEDTNALLSRNLYS